MTTPQGPTAHRARPLHLLWIIPLGATITFLAMFWMTLTWCGISGCSGGGFGRSGDPSVPGMLIGVSVIAMTWFTLLSVPRWMLGMRERLITGVFVGVVAAVLAANNATDGFVR